MPVCQHCKKEWTYAQSLKNLFWLKCPYCKNRNYARKARPRDIIFGVTNMIFILFIFPMLHIPFKWSTTIVLIGVVIYIATYPINLQLSKEEEPIF